MAKLTHLTFSCAIEAADTERRIISGQIVPFGAVGNTNVGKVIFERGSIQIPNVSKIKLLAQHNSNDPIGRAQSFNETADGIQGTFKVTAASKGTDYLLMASEGLVDGLSVGVDVINSREMKNGTIIVTAALLKGVSLVESPAFTEARVTKVAAEEATEEISETVETSEEVAPVADVTETQPESEATVEETTPAATTEAAAAPAAGHTPAAWPACRAARKDRLGQFTQPSKRRPKRW